MTLTLQEILSDPAIAEQLRAELAAQDAANAEPPAPPTLLDDLREDIFDLTPGEIPNPHEVPVLLGVLVHEFLELTQRVAELEGAADSGQVVTPAPEPSGVPDAGVPAPAPAADRTPGALSDDPADPPAEPTSGATWPGGQA